MGDDEGAGGGLVGGGNVQEGRPLWSTEPLVGVRCVKICPQSGEVQVNGPQSMSTIYQNLDVPANEHDTFGLYNTQLALVR